MNTAGWQAETIQRFAAFFEAHEAAKALILVGSNTRAEIDLLSDVDLICVIDDAQMEQFFPDTQWLAAFGDILGIEQSASPISCVTRVCFSDFHRIDLVFMPEGTLKQPQNWPYTPAERQVLFSRSAIVETVLNSTTITQRKAPVFDNQQFERMSQQFWFKASLAATKVMRNDLLIGLHLALDLARDCLVLAMIFRDVEAGTNHHRYGGPYNEIIEQLGLGVFRSTSQGILDLILQIALTFDSLALRWSPTYQCKYEILQNWIKRYSSG